MGVCGRCLHVSGIQISPGPLFVNFSFFYDIARDFRDFSQDELSDDVKFIFCWVIKWLQFRHFWFRSCGTSLTRCMRWNKQCMLTILGEQCSMEAAELERTRYYTVWRLLLEILPQPWLFLPSPSVTYIYFNLHYIKTYGRLFYKLVLDMYF